MTACTAGSANAAYDSPPACQRLSSGCRVGQAARGERRSSRGDGLRVAGGAGRLQQAACMHMRSLGHPSPR